MVGKNWPYRIKGGLISPSIFTILLLVIIIAYSVFGCQYQKERQFIYGYPPPGYRCTTQIKETIIKFPIIITSPSWIVFRGYYPGINH